MFIQRTKCTRKPNGSNEKKQRKKTKTVALL